MVQTNPSQKRAVSLAQLIAHIDIGTPQDAPRVILSVSPCRSATTALLRVFGAVGIESHYQELKNVLRWLVQGEEVVWRLPRGAGELIYLKETVGPFTDAEVRFDPVAVLRGAGLPPEKLHVIISGRTPLSTWDSWYQWDGRWTTVDKFIQAYQTVERIRQQALQQGLAMTTFVYEAIRDNAVADVFMAVFERLGIPYAPVAVQGWHRLARLGQLGSNVIFPKEPATFIVPDVHKRVMESDSFTFFSRAERIPYLQEDDVRQIAMVGLADIYHSWLRGCEQDLGIAIESDRDWEIWHNAHL